MGSAGYTRSGRPDPAAGTREEGCAGDRGIDRRDGPAERDGLRRVRRSRGLVVPSAPLRAVRAHRLLRLLAGPARQRACGRLRAPADQELRAGRVMVLELRGGPDVRQRAGTGAARAPSRRPAGARPGGPPAPRLAVQAPLAGPRPSSRGRDRAGRDRRTLAAGNPAFPPAAGPAAPGPLVSTST